MKQRVISAVVLLAIALTCIFVSFVTRVIFFGVVGILCAYEYSRGLEKINVYCAAWVMYVYIAVQAVLALTHTGALSYIACSRAAFTSPCSPASYIRRSRARGRFTRWPALPTPASSTAS